MKAIANTLTGFVLLMTGMLIPASSAHAYSTDSFVGCVRNNVSWIDNARPNAPQWYQNTTWGFGAAAYVSGYVPEVSPYVRTAYYAVNTVPWYIGSVQNCL